MAKLSMIAKNEQRKKTVAKFAVRRAALKEIIRNPKSTEAARVEAQTKLQKQPRDAAMIRVRNRCAVTGRSRGNLRQFGMSRMVFRDLANKGLVPGVTKASW